MTLRVETSSVSLVYTYSEFHHIHKCIIVVREAFDNFILDAVNWLNLDTLKDLIYILKKLNTTNSKMTI